ncbi:MAG: RHS repeat-associated core domain-containing protein, partial [Bacteroidota bacterium]
MLDNSDISYQAGTEITLDAGFSVEIGAEFTAEIVPCATGGDWVYQYYLADHLGNNRILFADLDGNETIETSEILQENHYYAFGMEMAGDWQGNTSGPDQRYRYNGKEYQGELGLYDYGARWYDPSTARWGQVDPLGEEMPNWSPYNYVFSNPIRLTDPTGMIPAGLNDNDYKFGFAKLVQGDFDLEDAPDNEYTVNTKTGKVTKTGSTGGDDYDVVTYTNSDCVPCTNTERQTAIFINPHGDSGKRVAPGVFQSPFYHRMMSQGTVHASDTPVELITAGAKKGAGLLGMLLLRKKSGDAMFEIADGVRRAKAAQMLGRKSIRAENGTTGEYLDIRISRLLSPKSGIDVSNPLELQRFNRIINGFKNGDNIPPIYVHPG